MTAPHLHHCPCGDEIGFGALATPDDVATWQALHAGHEAPTVAPAPTPAATLSALASVLGIVAAPYSATAVQVAPEAAAALAREARRRGLRGVTRSDGGIVSAAL